PPAVVEQAPSGPSSPPPETEWSGGRHPHRALGVGGIATRVVAAAAGGWLLSLHHQYTGMCVGPDKMVGCNERWNTAAGGSALMAGGGLVLTLGILAVAGVF